MKIVKNTIIAFGLLALLLVSGCTEKFEEINTDPDNPALVPTNNQLAWTIWYTSYRLYDRWFLLDEPCTFAGYAAKLNYIDEARYQFRATVQDSHWAYIYRILLNLRELQAKAEELGSSNLGNVAKILEAKVVHIFTDRWRDVPYFDAVKLEEGILLPKYDRQEDIYPALLALLKDVADNLAAGAGTDDISGGDLLYGGDIDKWQKYANSLRLRLAIRISEVSPALAKQTVEEILGAPATYPLITDNDDNAFFWWDANDANRFEPWAEAYRTRPDLEFCSSDVIIDNLKANSDPRLPVYARPTLNSVADGSPDYVGYTVGASANGVPAALSGMGARFETNRGGFSPYYRAAETWFLIAEAAMLNYNTGGISASEAYTTAVTLSLEENGIDAADIAAYLSGAGAFDNTKKKIWYEEWVALFKQGMEGWSLYRRTGTPDFLYIAPGRDMASYGNHNVPPFRSPYPDKERNLNGANNKPFDAEVEDDFWGKQLWWDTRTGVH
jgi:hypothetical protein